MATTEVTEQTPEDISNSNKDKGTENGQASQSSQELATTDSSDRNDLTEIGVERENIENFTDDRNGTCLNVEKQYAFIFYCTVLESIYLF